MDFSILLTTHKFHQTDQTVICAHFKTAHMFSLSQAKSTKQVIHKHKTYTQTSTINSERLNPSNTALVIKVHEAGMLVQLTIPSDLSVLKKSIKRNQYVYKCVCVCVSAHVCVCVCIMTNTSAIWQQATQTTYQLLSPSCSTRAIQKSLFLD